MKLSKLSLWCACAQTNNAEKINDISHIANIEQYAYQDSSLIGAVANFIKDAFCSNRTKQDGKRVEFIDLAKGVGIFLVVLLHMDINFPLMDQIRMPLFFVLSGLFFKNYGLRVLSLKKINKLLIPFFVFNVLGEIYFYVEGLVFTDIKPHFEWAKVIFCLKANGVIWFLLALLWDNLLFYIVYKLSQSNLVRVALIIVLTSLGLYLKDVGNWWYISSALISMPFFALGFFLRKTSLLNVNAGKKISLWISLALFLFMSVIIIFVEDAKISFVDTIIDGNTILAYILSSIGVIAILLLCKRVKWMPLFSYMGRYSIIVLCVHIFPVNLITHFRQKFFGEDNLAIFAAVLIVFAISIFAIPILKRYTPWAVAQKDLIKV